MWFKSLSAVVLLSSCNTLGFLTQQTNTNVLPGFHITIKSNNTNDIFVNNKWNKINETYQNFVMNDIPHNLIKVSIDNWNDIVKQQTNNIKEQVYNSFINDQVNKATDLSLLKDNESKFGTKAIGSSIANINSQSQINSFGSVYIPYYDSLQTKIDNGVFATIYPQYDFSNYFSVPYTIQPSANLLNQTIDQRIKVMPINNDSWNSTNERQLVILAKKPNEELSINGSTSNIINTDNLAYALLDHNSNNGFDPTTYTISVIDKSTDKPIYSNNIKLTNTTSDIQFTTNDSSKNDVTTLNHDYLVFNKSDQQKDLIVMNEAQNNAKLKLFGDKSWVSYNVDPKTLQVIMNPPTTVDENTVLGINSIDDNYQVYYLQQQQNTKPAPLNNSGQYLVVYRTTCPSFNNWTNLNDDSNSLLSRGFQQYLAAISTDMPLDNLEKNASQLITYYIDYQKDLQSHNFVNYFGNDKTKPWALNTKLQEVTLVSNWKIIIISGVMILFLTFILPLLIFLLKKEKRLK